MQEYIKQIEACLNRGLYLPALMCSLALPDICASLASPCGVTTGKSKVLYEKWYDENAAKYCSNFLTGTECYQFRCRLLHNGSAQMPKIAPKYRIIFLEPDSSCGCIMHDNLFQGKEGDTLNIDVGIFCRGMLNAVLEWFEQNKDTEPVRTNYSTNLIHRYPEGLAPYIGGTPVIG